MTNLDYTIDGYKQYLEKRPDACDIEYIKTKIQVLELMNHKTQEEIDEMFNTAVFNDICKGYCRMALLENNIPEETIESIMDSLHFLFEMTTASVARSHA